MPSVKVTVKGVWEANNLIAGIQRRLPTESGRLVQKMAYRLRQLMIQNINRDSKFIHTGALARSIKVNRLTTGSYAVTVADKAAMAIEKGRRAEDYNTFKTQRNSRGDFKHRGKKIIFMEGIGFRTLTPDSGPIRKSRPMGYASKAITRLRKERASMAREMLKKTIRK
jgi:hypothetical protein